MTSLEQVISVQVDVKHIMGLPLNVFKEAIYTSQGECLCYHGNVCLYTMLAETIRSKISSVGYNG